MDLTDYSTTLPKIQRIPFAVEPLEKVTLTEEQLLSKCYVADGETRAARRNKKLKVPHFGANLGRMHLWKLCSFDRFANLTTCNLSRNFLTDIQGLSACLKLVWLDLHENHIESLPDELFWSGFVSLKILNVHNNLISQLVNIKYVSACRNLEVLTLYDTPVSVHPFYRHCCVNKIVTLKALDHHLISDDEVIEGFLCPPKFTKYANGLRTRLRPRVSEGMNGVYSVLRRINTIQAKMSPCLFIQRVYRGYRCRRILKQMIRLIRQNEWHGEEFDGGDVFNLTAVMNSFSKDKPRMLGKIFDKYHLPPIMPPVTPQHTQLPPSRATIFSASHSLRLVLHKMMHSNDFESVLKSISTRRMDVKTDQYIKEVADVVFDELPDSARSAKSVRTKASKKNKMIAFQKETVPGDERVDFLTTRSLSSDSLMDMAEFRVPTANYGIIGIAESDMLTVAEVKQIDAQMVKQADADYHLEHRLQEQKDLQQKQAEKEVRPVNMNAIRDRVAAEEHLTQQLACLAAVEKAYHERTFRETRFMKATTVLASREATTQAIRKQSALITSARENVGNAIRTERHIAHHVIERLKEKDAIEKQTSHQKQMEDRAARRTKMESFRAVSDLRQRFCAISASINRYDWANRQYGLLERARGTVDQIQQAKSAANILLTERNRKRVNDIAAVNQLEIRRAHEAIEASNEVELDLARKRVNRVKSDKPERYPPQLPGPGSLAIDGISHAAYNPIIGGAPPAPPKLEGSKYSRLGSPVDRPPPKPELVDIRERWRVMASLPDGHIGLHPIEAQIS